MYGPLFVPEDLEKAVRDLLVTWLPSYFYEVERQQGIEPNKIARPKTYLTSVEADAFPGEEFPVIIVVAPGTVGDPERLNGGKYASWYQVTVACLVQTPNEVSTRALASYYAAAVRGAVLQHGSISGTVSGTDWLGEEYEGTDRNRTRAAMLVHFRVKVEEIVDPQNGPKTPPPEVPPGWTTVQEVSVDVEPITVDGAATMSFSFTTSASGVVN